MFFVGDVHGKIPEYLAVINKIGDNPSYQVGDMGLGFRGVYLPTMKPNHKFIRGNHDNPATCRKHANYAGDWGYDKENGIFFVGGADSIDKEDRTLFVSWWPDEELSMLELQKAIDSFKEIKPRIVVTHDAPEIVMNMMFPWCIGHSRTRQALEEMLNVHVPEHWVFGHHHSTQSVMYQDKCQFHCVTELDFIEIE